MPRIERPVERIAPLMAELQAHWLRNPNLRLTQLLVNLVASPVPCPEVFYFEDDVLLQRLHEAAVNGDAERSGPSAQLLRPLRRC